jgi:hypothetical protein
MNPAAKDRAANAEMVRDLDHDKLVTEISAALPKAARPIPSDEAKAAIDNIRCRKVVNMAPFRGGTDKAKLVNFVHDVWAVLSDLDKEKKSDHALYALHLSCFVRTMAVTWDNDGRQTFNKFKPYNKAFPFYDGIVEQALKRKDVPRLSTALLLRYNTFHDLLVKLDWMNKRDLIPGAIGNLGVGGFSNESMDDQIRILMGVKRTMTRDAIKEAYESYVRPAPNGAEDHDPMALQRGAYLLQELQLGDISHDEMVAKVRQYKDAMFAYEQRPKADDTGYSDWVSALDRPSASLAKLGVLFNVVDLPPATFEDLKSRICTMLKDAGDKHRAERADTISTAIANLGLVDADEELVKTDEVNMYDMEQYEGMFD